MGVALARFREHLLAREQAELDADAGESDAVTAGLGRGGHVVEPPQLGASHADAVIDDRERGAGGIGGIGGIGEQPDGRGAGVERVRHHFGEDCFLELTRIGVGQILEQMEQIDARFAHGQTRWQRSQCGVEVQT